MPERQLKDVTKPLQPATSCDLFWQPVASDDCVYALGSVEGAVDVVTEVDKKLRDIVVGFISQFPVQLPFPMTLVIKTKPNGILLRRYVVLAVVLALTVTSLLKRINWESWYD